VETRIPSKGFGPAPDFPPETFAARRDRLLERIGDGVVVVGSAPELKKSRDTEVPFRQSSDLHYLTGFPEPDSVAVITPHDSRHRFTLFVRPRNPEQEAWSGTRFGVERAGEEFGADAVYPIDGLAERLPDLIRPADVVHCPIGTVDFVDPFIAEALFHARRTRQRTGVGPRGVVDLEVSTGEMRLIKEPAELDRIRTAAQIAAAGHLEAMRHTRPGVGEWEIQAALEGAFRSLGAASPAFPSIVAGGSSATVLHYVANEHRVRDGDLVLVDAGPEWGMYCADITRTFPASGRFSDLQRDLYHVVLAAEEAAIAAAEPGAPVTNVHDAAVRVLTRGMIDFGLLDAQSVDEAIETGAFRKYYLHNTSHWIGLDVHDAGPYRSRGEPVVLQAGQVMTIEPGLYVPLDSEGVPEALRGVGIRIEDDIVVTEEGNEILTRAVPVEPERIEAAMRGD
jgi:Xaa-Pro aminopeptidase